MGGLVNTKKNEGFRSKTYTDTTGNLTTGYGFNLNDPVTAGMLPEDVISGSRGLTRKEADEVFQKRMALAQADAVQFLGDKHYQALDPLRQSVLNDMAYNMGLPKLAGFKKFKKALLSGDYEKAADEMKNSKWYKQTKKRAKDLTEKMRAGQQQAALEQEILNQLL